MLVNRDILEWVAQVQVGDALKYPMWDVVEAMTAIGYPEPTPGAVMTSWLKDAPQYAKTALEDYDSTTSTP